MLDEFLTWLVENTKENHRFHVMMAYSDSFIHKCDGSYFDGSYFNNVAIGHLSKDEASRYWKEISGMP